MYSLVKIKDIIQGYGDEKSRKDIIGIGIILDVFQENIHNVCREEKFVYLSPLYCLYIKNKVYFMCELGRFAENHIDILYSWHSIYNAHNGAYFNFHSIYKNDLMFL